MTPGSRRFRTAKENTRRGMSRLKARTPMLISTTIVKVRPRTSPRMAVTLRLRQEAMVNGLVLFTMVASSRTETTHRTNMQHPKPMLCNNLTTLHPLRTLSTLSRRHTHLILMLVRLPCRTQMELRGLSPTLPPSLHTTLTTWRALGQAIRPRQRPSPPQPLITHTRRRTMRHHRLNTALPRQAPRMHTQRRRTPNTQLAL